MVASLLWRKENVMKALLVRFLREDDGQDLVEYALLAAGISLATIGAITAIADALDTQYSNIATQISNVPGGS
jgi:pilus assembly protein Flp/PilA